MDYELLKKMKLEELKNYLKICGLKVTVTKKFGSPSICSQ